MLCQAFIFGWHHHPLPFSIRAGSAVTAPHSGAPLSPLSADDDCQICAALHHLSAAPVEFSALPIPASAPAAAAPSAPLFVAGTAALAFRARAPPQA